MIGAAFLLAATLSAGNAEFDRTAAEGAARISLNRFAAELVRTGLPTGDLAAAMLAEPARFSDRREAEALCRELYGQILGKAVDAEAGAVRRRLGLPEDFTLAIRPADREALFACYPDAFSREREAAVATQARGIAATTRPTEAELETKDDETLRREMTEKILAGQKTAVFEENARYVTEELVSPILASGREERNRQNDYLKRARCEASAPSTLAAELQEKLESNVAERMRGVVPTKAWGVFPSVRARGIPEQVDRRLTERFVRRIDEVTLAITADEVETIIVLDPAAHVKASDSRKIFTDLYARRILDEAQAKALGDYIGPERTELQGYLSARLDSDVFRKAVDRVVRREVRPKWNAARAEVARRVAESVWPTLGNGSWYPGAELADAVSARSDYAEAVRGWRKLEEMAPLAAAGGDRPLLEESAGTADRQVAAAFDRARNAIAAQNAIVDEVHPAVLAEARERPTDLRTVEKSLLSATAGRWDERRESVLWPDGKLPPNAAEQHVDIFPSVLKKIELVARQILEEIIQEQQPKPEAPVEETPPDEQPPEEELFSLSVRRTGGGLEIRLMQGNAVVQESVVPARAKDFREAMRLLTDTLSTKVLDLR